MMTCYNYRFVQNEAMIDNDIILTRKIYSFKSTQTNHTYIVLIDECKYDLYVIKFYLKNHRLSEYKYNILSNLKEPRNVLYTCMSIAIDEIYQNNDRASFGFVAANLKNEEKSNTKRFSFYRKFITSLIGTDTFSHFTYEEQSAYLLIPSVVVKNNPNANHTYTELFHSYLSQ